MKLVRRITSTDLLSNRVYLTEECMKDIASQFINHTYPIYYGHDYSNLSSYIGYTTKGFAKIGFEGGDSVDKSYYLEVEANYYENVTAGAEFIKYINNNAYMGASIGFDLVDYEYDSVNDIFIINKVIVKEYSETPIPADTSTLGKFNILNEGIVQSNLPLQFSKWTKSYIDSLPDDCFAVVESPKYRHLPFKDLEGRVNLPLLKFAQRSMYTITPFTSMSEEELRSIAISNLTPYIEKYINKEMKFMAKKQENISSEVLESKSEDVVEIVEAPAVEVLDTPTQASEESTEPLASTEKSGEEKKNVNVFVELQNSLKLLNESLMSTNTKLNSLTDRLISQEEELSKLKQNNVVKVKKFSFDESKSNWKTNVWR